MVAVNNMNVCAQCGTTALYKRDGTGERFFDTFGLGFFRVIFSYFLSRYLVNFADEAVIGGEPKPQGERER